jgi:branched-chain amino acid transport system permease protein
MGEQLVQFVITGITVGMVYSLIALSFVLVWKSSGVANLALGQLVLVSSWIAYTVLSPDALDLPVWLGLPVIIIAALILGWVIERVVLRPLIAQPILSLITVTLGIGFFLEGVITIAWPQSIAHLPRLFPQHPIVIGPATLSYESLWTVIITLTLFGLLSLYFKYSRMGIAMRASADDQHAVQACGVPVTKIFSRSWMLTCVLAAVGGILISSIGGITPGLVETGLRAFSVVILGGLDSFLGAIIAGPIIGLAENVGGGFLTPLTWPGVREIIPFVIIVIVMFVKPYGLFGETRIERI